MKRCKIGGGRGKGYDVPVPADFNWLRIVDPESMPSESLAFDLGAGEIAAMALALENPPHIILLDLNQHILALTGET